MNFKNELKKLEDVGLKRILKNFEPDKSMLRGILGDKKVINFSSNSYLGLDNHPKIIETIKDATQNFPVSASASRLISATNSIVLKTEKKIAEWKKSQKALIFNSGYTANLGVISAIANRNSEIFLDKLNHASIVDGAILSRAKISRFPHNDVKILEKLLQKSNASHKIIVVDSLFSMDGDFAPIEEISALAKRFNAIFMVDEAHATGVFGKTGGGVCEELGILDKIDIQMGTFSKGMGLFGAYVVAKEEIIDFLINKSRSFIFTTALPPFLYAGIDKSIEIVASNEGVLLRKKLRGYIEKIKNAKIDINSQIFPLILGSVEKTMEKYQTFLQNGVLALPVRPPTVPKGTSRLRISISAGHLEKEIDLLINLLTNHL